MIETLSQYSEGPEVLQLRNELDNLKSQEFKQINSLKSVIEEATNDIEFYDRKRSNLKLRVEHLKQMENEERVKSLQKEKEEIIAEMNNSKSGITVSNFNILIVGIVLETERLQLSKHLAKLQSEREDIDKEVNTYTAELSSLSNQDISIENYILQLQIDKQELAKKFENDLNRLRELRDGQLQDLQSFEEENSQLKNEAIFWRIVAQRQSLVVKEQEDKKSQIEEEMNFFKMEKEAEIRNLRQELVNAGKIEAGTSKEELDKELLELKSKCDEDKQKALTVESIRKQLEMEMEIHKAKKVKEATELRENLNTFKERLKGNLLSVILLTYQ